MRLLIWFSFKNNLLEKLFKTSVGSRKLSNYYEKKNNRKLLKKKPFSGHQNCSQNFDKDFGKFLISLEAAENFTKLEKTFYKFHKAP